MVAIRQVLLILRKGSACVWISGGLSRRVFSSDFDAEGTREDADFRGNYILPIDNFPASCGSRCTDLRTACYRPVVQELAIEHDSSLYGATLRLPAATEKQAASKNHGRKAEDGSQKTVFWRSPMISLAGYHPTNCWLTIHFLQTYLPGCRHRVWDVAGWSNIPTVL